MTGQEGTMRDMAADEGYTTADGRKGVLKATLELRDAKVFGQVAARMAAE